MEKTLPESIIFYLDIFGKLLSKRNIVKNLEMYAKEKLAKNPLSEFSVFYYKEHAEPFLSNDNTDIEEISKVIEEDWKHRDKQESHFENGLFFCLSALAAKAVKKEGTYRIIVITDLPSNKGSDYTEALMGLVETVRSFPTFIDIIRVGTEHMYPDDVKLRIISTLTSGAVFYTADAKQFKNVLEGLVRNKKLPGLAGNNSQVIESDKKLYYENLSLSLANFEDSDDHKCKLCDSVLCNFCGDNSDITKQCPQCGHPYHECCAGLYSWRQNIGLKHVFRCVKCEALIKIEEELVYSINGEPLEFDPLNKEELDEKFKDEETWNPDESIEEPLEISKVEVDELEFDEKSSIQAKVQPGGFFGPKPKILKKEDSSLEAKDTEIQSTKPKQIEDDTSKTIKTEATMSALARRKARKKRSTSTLMMCQICMTPIKPNMRKCPKCGSPV
jgi:rubrerythrin